MHMDYVVLFLNILTYLIATYDNVSMSKYIISCYFIYSRNEQINKISLASPMSSTANVAFHKVGDVGLSGVH